MNEEPTTGDRNMRRDIKAKTSFWVYLFLAAHLALLMFWVVVMSNGTVVSVNRHIDAHLQAGDTLDQATKDKLIELEHHREKVSAYYVARAKNNQVAALLDEFAADYTRHGPEEAAKKFLTGLEKFDAHWDKLGHDPLVLIGPEPKAREDTKVTTVTEVTEVTKTTEGGGKDEPAKP
jgi:hypothetical protein